MQDHSGTSANIGGWHDWHDLLEIIEPWTRSSFKIVDHFGFYGSDANNAFFVQPIYDSNPRTHITTYECCPFGGGNNKFVINKLEPESVYVASFRGRSGDGSWHDNSVPTGDHPVSVEYTIKYQERVFFFQLIEITAKTDHPVRNSRNELITGCHRLWPSDSDASWMDSESGSYAPNVFAYDFKSKVVDSGHLDVTVIPRNLELIGAEVIMYGTINGNHVLQTDYFFMRTQNVVPAHFIVPTRSDFPFCKNADVIWSMELRQSHHGV